jgi:hypothetical protein
MHPTIHRAGRTTHLKIALVSLAAAIVVVAVGFNARNSTFDTTATAVVKPAPTPAYAGQGARDGSLTGSRRADRTALGSRDSL